VNDAQAVVLSPAVRFELDTVVAAARHIAGKYRTADSISFVEHDVEVLAQLVERVAVAMGSGYRNAPLPSAPVSVVPLRGPEPGVGLPVGDRGAVRAPRNDEAPEAARKARKPRRVASTLDSADRAMEAGINAMPLRKEVA
jgi:hypothetical protein